jgi:integrase
MNRIIATAKIPRIRFHDIRHSQCRILISKGVDLVKVSHRLGHSNAKIKLEYYAYLMPNDYKEAADILNDAIDQSSRKMLAYFTLRNNLRN